MSVRSGQLVVVGFTTRRFDTGARTNADSPPTGTLYINGIPLGTAVTVTQTVDGIVGSYKASVTLPALSIDDEVYVRITATVNSVTDNGIIWEDSADILINSTGGVASDWAQVQNPNAVVTLGNTTIFNSLNVDTVGNPVIVSEIADGNVTAATSTTVTILANNSQPNGTYKGLVIRIRDIFNVFADQYRIVTGFVSSTGTATVQAAWDRTPTNTDQWAIYEQVVLPISVDTLGRVKIQSGMPINTAINNFEFPMYLSSDHVSPATGLTVTAQRSIDGGAYGACTNAVAEVSNGTYKINISASDLNGAVIKFRFTAVTADATEFTMITTP